MRARARRIVSSLVAALAMACGGSQSSIVGAGQSAERPVALVAPASRYRLGEFVVYRYSGAYSRVPVELRETVTGVEGLRLTIEVQATRGDEVRRWVQLVTDTAENRDNNVVDELYEVIHGERRRLPNEGNQDLLRLYDWTLPPCGPPVVPLAPESRPVRIADTEYPCSCDRIQAQCDGRAATMTMCECHDFVWNHAFGEVLREGDDGYFWRAEVAAHGP